jgi:hypothetical protein
MRGLLVTTGEYCLGRLSDAEGCRLLGGAEVCRGAAGTAGTAAVAGQVERRGADGAVGSVGPVTHPGDPDLLRVLDACERLPLALSMVGAAAVHSALGWPALLELLAAASPTQAVRPGAPASASVPASAPPAVASSAAHRALQVRVSS